MNKTVHNMMTSFMQLRSSWNLSWNLSDTRETGITRISATISMYGKCSKISNTFLFLLSNKKLVFRAEENWGVQYILISSMIHVKDICGYFQCAPFLVCKRGKLSGSCLSTLNGFGSTQLPIFLCHIGVPTFSSQNNKLKCVRNIYWHLFRTDCLSTKDR